MDTLKYIKAELEKNRSRLLKVKEMERTAEQIKETNTDISSLEEIISELTDIERNFKASYSEVKQATEQQILDQTFKNYSIGPMMKTNET